MQSSKGEIAAVNISVEKGTIKEPVAELTLDDRGCVGDAHAGAWHRQVSLLATEKIVSFGEELKRKIEPGEFAENISTSGVDLGNVAVLDTLSIGDVRLEVTQIGKRCHGAGCAIFTEIGKCVMPKEGIFSRVKHGGTIRPGDTIIHQSRPFQCWVITVSDRASQGVYEDKSGPRIRELLEQHMDGRRWHLEITTALVPDDESEIAAVLEKAQAAGADVVITTGGTGIGPRDITVEVVEQRMGKSIPGIMEHIRLKYGAKKPNALLSRGVAGVMGEGLVFTLPGSTRAVEEYMREILLVLEHLILMLHSIDAH